VRRAAPALPLAIAMLGATLMPATAPLAPATATAGLLPQMVLDSPFAIHFLDVGTGDSAIIDVGEQEVIIDGGDSVRVLNDYVARTGIIDGPIELVVVTHADSDHWKGLTRLLGFDGKNAHPPEVLEFWEPGYDRDCRPLASFDQFIRSVHELPGLTFRRPLGATHPDALTSGDVTEIEVPRLPDVHFSVLHTDAEPPASNGDCAYRINNASIVLAAEIFGHRFLFTGDANGKERDEGTPDAPAPPGHIEQLLLGLDPAVLAAEVLKVPHHGSETASTQEFIDRVDPEFVVVSASTKHHLPKGTVIDRYDDGQRVILRTDDNRPNDTDHIVCFQDQEGALECNFETVLREV